VLLCAVGGGGDTTPRLWQDLRTGMLVWRHVSSGAGLLAPQVISDRKMRGGQPGGRRQDYGLPIP
jgi:hypothetical protein